MYIRTFVVSMFETNCYLIGCEKTGKAAVIDPGDSADLIAESAQDEGFTIEKIINTHGHIDHAAGVQDLKDIVKAPFYLHKEDEDFLAAMPEHGKIFGMHVERYPSVEGYLQDGDIIEIGNISLKVLHTPGHTRGGCSFLGEREVFSGDTLFAGSIGRTDLPGGSYETLIHSIRMKLLTLDEYITVYCGHGPTTTIGREKLSNPFLR